MTVLDTHIWVWWVQGTKNLHERQRAMLDSGSDDLVVSAISLWEIAKSVQLGRLTLPLPVKEWLELALSYPGIRLEPLSSAIVAESISLPGSFHRDPSDHLIVATARILDCELLTADTKILSYGHVKLRP